jgi:uncharacterized protein (UPF0254 family)
MRTSIGAGIAAGVTVGGAGRAAVELVTETADAQSGRQTLSQNLESQAEGSNLRSQRGIKQATTVWNQLSI